MDFKLAKEIYGNAWCVDPITFQELSKTLSYFQTDGIIEKPEIKSNAFGILAKDNVFTANEIIRNEKKGIQISKESIAQYNFDSVITKGGGASHYGTKDISAQFSEMEANENIIGHLFYVESGGGSVNAIRFINNVASKGIRKKPLVTYFEDVNGSAAYVISSNSDWIIANNKSAMVGSIGVMMEMQGFKNGTVDSNGITHLRVYSNLSSEKNIEFEKALNEQNIELIQSNILDPSANELIDHVVAQRPNITAKQKRAAIFRAEEVVGTLIDEIGSIENAYTKIRELANITSEAQKNNTPQTIGENNNLKIESMDLAKLKAEHPAVYAQAVAEGKQIGVSEERDRVEAWAVFNEIDPVKVKAGIESGKQLTAKATAEFSLQTLSAKKLEEMKEESPAETNTETEIKTEAQIKAEKMALDFDNEFLKGGE